MAGQQGWQGPLKNGVTALANPGVRKQLFQSDYNATTEAGTLFNATALPSNAGTWRESQILNIETIRRLKLEFRYNANAATTTGYPLIMLLTSSTGSTPALSDDVWSYPLITDFSVTAAALTGTVTDWSGNITVTPQRNTQQYRGLVIKPEVAAANSDKMRGHIYIDVAAERYFYLIAAEAGDVTNRGILDIWFTGAS